VPLLTASAGQSIDLGDGGRIDVMSPPPDGLEGTDDDINNNSVVLRVIYGSVSFLLTGDLAADGETALIASGVRLQSTVLKVGHHGSDSSTTPAFLDAVEPVFAVVSTGEENSFGHPSPTTRRRLAGTPLPRTDLNGDVRFETNGSALWVSTQRGEYGTAILGAAR
jgi:competence protein ComEC